MGKLIIFTAPSGAGKTTIVRHLLQQNHSLAFSVSATTRSPRPGEIHGRDYYFFSKADFEQAIRNEAFAEWEEVYQGLFYGTLRSEIDRLWKAGKHVLFDIDVKGAMSLKQQYPEQTLTVFVMPPSPETLFERLRARSTETEASLQKRLAKAKEELLFVNKCDKILVNNVLENALEEAENLVHAFLNEPL